MRPPGEVVGSELVPDVEPEAARGRYGRSNLVVVGVQVAGWAMLLSVIDAAVLPLWVRVPALLLFCLLMQGVFTMLHEFCHGNAHGRPWLNYLLGWTSSTLFGTAPTLLRVQHWGHHRRNRSAAERAEFIHEGERAWPKTTAYYAAILGGIWLGCLLASLAAPFISFAALRRAARHERFNTFAAAFREFTAAEWRAVRLEGLLLATAWTGLVLLGPWRPMTIAIAYAAFAFSWSSLQWIYHMHTPLHAVEGAYNLRAPGLVRHLFLNFNYNLTHHRSPATPWQELYAASDPRETQPLWYRYLLVFRPPVPFPKDPSVLHKRYF